MKLKYEFEKVEIDDDIIAVPIGEGSDEFHGVLRLNDTAVAILDLLKEETIEEKIVDELLKTYEGDRDEIAGYVHEYILELEKEGLIV